MVALRKDLPHLFDLGRVVATPGALQALKDAAVDGKELLDRHHTGDFGDLSADDKTANNEALKDGSQILSAYKLPNGIRIWVITDAAGDDGRRACTTLLLPNEY